MARKSRKTDAIYAVLSARTTHEWFEWFMKWKTPALMKNNMEELKVELELFDAYPDVFDSIDDAYPRAYIIRLEEHIVKLEDQVDAKKRDISFLHKLTDHTCIKAILDFSNEKCKIDRVYHEIKLIERSVSSRRAKKTEMIRSQQIKNRTVGRVSPKGFRLVGKIPDDIIKRANGIINKHKSGEIKPRITHKCRYLVLNIGRDWRLLNRGTGYELMSHERYNSLVIL